jgi:lipid-A-disaccharide synthase-like uncharacterized protein
MHWARKILQWRASFSPHVDQDGGIPRGRSPSLDKSAILGHQSLRHLESLVQIVPRPARGALDEIATDPIRNRRINKLSMNILALIAITWIGKEYRFLGLDWSYLMILGFVGNALFSMRFLVQWLASERQGESVIPVSFWYWSIAGSALMCLYFVFRRDPVGILAYLPNSLIYIRNLVLIRKRKFAFTAAAPSQHPREAG